MSANTLRHYDKKGIFKPAKLGKEFENSYRYYDPTQITTIKMILVLTEIGVPLETIRELANSRSPESLLKLFSKHKGIIGDELRFLHGVHSVISTFMELLTEGISATESEISVAEMPGKQIILGETNQYTDCDGFHREYMRFCNSPHEPKLNLANPVGGYFASMDEFLDEPSKPTRFFSIDPSGLERKAEGLYLIGYSRGYYGDTGDLPDRMMAFADKNEMVFTGPVFNIYLHDEMSIVDPSNYLLQVSASVRETRRVSSRRPAPRTHI